MKWYKKLKVFKCYLFILAWIGIILISYSYWKIEIDNDHSSGPFLQKGHMQSNVGVLVSDKMRSKKIRTYCNFPEKIKPGHEGEIATDYELTGIIVIMRHGDRGPLMEVKNFSSLNCGHKKGDTAHYRKYVTDLLNASKTNDYIKFVGPFMKYPIIPAPLRCSTTHLTPLGVTQLLRLGAMLKEIYIDRFGIISHPWNSDDIVIYSTKFRRTFQSALAFIYSFLPRFDLSNLKLNEAKAVNFCGDYCQCDKAAVYEKKFKFEKKDHLKTHPSVVKLVSDLSAQVKAHEHDDDITSPYVIRDALLSYACHGARYPCEGKNCVTAEDLTKLLSYEEWEVRQKGGGNRIKSAKLNSFGFLESIITSINTMIEQGNPKVTIYSGHDKSLNNLLSGLGVLHFQAPYYASRAVLELYRNTSGADQDKTYTKADYHFRLIYNGKDISRHLPFCNLSVVKQVDLPNAKSRVIGLCSVVSFENYVRSASYFKDFNVSSFTLACLK